MFTPLEVAFSRGRLGELAARFAAKEAVMKALGTGVRGVAWRDIEIIPDRRGKPLVYLHGGAKARAVVIGLSDIDVSLSHSQEYAVASAVGHAENHHEDDPDLWRREFAARMTERGLLKQPPQ